MRNLLKTLFRQIRPIILPTFVGIALGEAAYAYKIGPHYRGLLNFRTESQVNQQSVWQRDKKRIAMFLALLFLLHIVGNFRILSS